MSLRIISGERRGTHIDTPEGTETRPLRDRLRQALFNILRPYTRQAIVLDAFAGSGAVALEALSNGATRAVLVEPSGPAAHCIHRNIEKLRYEDRATLLRGESPGALAQLDRRHPAFDLLFLMPPYHSGLCEKVLGSADLEPRITPDPLAICELHKDEPFNPPGGWKLEQERTYGITRLVFLRRV